MSKITKLSNRCLIEIKGSDAKIFLQGLITNNIEQLSDLKDQHTSIYAAFLNPQGRYLTDAFIFKEHADSQNDSFWVDFENAHILDILKMLKMYKLRSNVQFIEHPEISIYATKEIASYLSNEKYILDPRNHHLGYRYYINTQVDPLHLQDNKNDYCKLLIQHLIPDGVDVIPYQRGFILEYGFDSLNAIDYNKGCYIGQELTARMHYRKMAKRELVCCNISTFAPIEVGAHLYFNDEDYGIVISLQDSWALLHIQSILRHHAQIIHTNDNINTLIIKDCYFTFDNKKTPSNDLSIYARV